MNKLCRDCRRSCKQTEAVKVLECKKYSRAPVQMAISFKAAHGKSKPKRIKVDDEKGAV